MRSNAFVLLLIVALSWAIPAPQTHYENRRIFSDDESPLFELRWTVESKTLRLAIIAETEDWVSLSFSHDGTVSDGIIARIGEEGAQVVDFFVPSDNSCPETLCADRELGCKNNAFDVQGKRDGKYIIVEYARPLIASDKCDQPADNSQVKYVHWSAGAREVLGMNIQTEVFSLETHSFLKRSPTVEMIVLGGRPLNMSIGTWFGHYTLEYWKNVDGATVQLNYDYNRQSFCTVNPSAVQVAGAELVTLDGYSIYVPKTKRTLRGVTIDWNVEEVEVSAGYCTTPTTNTVQCSQYNPDWPEAATDFIPLAISTSSLQSTWDSVCQVTSGYDFVESCTPNACWSVPVNKWTNTKYPDATASAAAGWYAIRDAQTSVEGQTNSNTFVRVHVRAVFNREITDLTPGGRDYPGNVYPVNVTDIWCGNKPWRTGIDPVPALKPCGTVKLASAPVTTTAAITTDEITSAVATFANIDPSTVQPSQETKGFNATMILTILDYKFRSGRSGLDLLKAAVDFNSTILQQFGIPGEVFVGDIFWEDAKVTDETLDGAATSMGASVMLLCALLAFLF